MFDWYFSDDNPQLENLKIVATLGIGAFGRVSLVKHKGTDSVYALKILSKAHLSKMKQKDHVVNERAILIPAKCDFIVRYDPPQTPLHPSGRLRPPV